MHSYRTRKSGFTLVEILIVVIILGILAAIVIPQFTNASQDARESSLRSQLQSMRSQIALYKLQHRDTPPTAASTADFWGKLTALTNEFGETTASGTNPTPDIGPYFDDEVVNPMTNGFDITTYDSTAGDPAAVAGADWYYDPDTGTLEAAYDAAGTLFVD